MCDYKSHCKSSQNGGAEDVDDANRSFTAQESVSDATACLNNDVEWSGFWAELFLFSNV